MIYLITGNCGAGKTWVMRGLIALFNMTIKGEAGLYSFLQTDSLIILGKYEEDVVFAGSDKLSMSVMKDNHLFKQVINNRIVIAEGDRFTNSTFIRDFNPVIVRITDNGEQGRIKRGSQQTERHIKSIETRVNNIKPHFVFPDSTQCLMFLKNQIEFAINNKPKQQSLF